MSQINFFMGAEDEYNFFRFLCARDDTAIYSGREFRTQNPEQLDDLPPPVERRLTIVHPGLAEVYPPQQDRVSGCYAFPLFHSAWVEWTRSVVLSGGELEAGRVFAKVGWLPEPADNYKYKLRYGAIERWLKRSFRQLDSTWWIGAAAEEWSRSGGVLAFGSSPYMRRSLASG